MKSRLHFPTRFLLAAALGAGLVFTTTTPADTNFWDGALIGGTGNGVSNGGTNTWDTSTSNWDTGAVARIAWDNLANNFAVFGGTVGLVTLSTPITASGMRFDTTGYVVSNSTLTLTGDHTINVNGASVSATIKSVIDGSVGLTKTGAGTLTITGANTYTGDTTISGGTLTIGGAGLLGNGNYAGNISIANGAVLSFTANAIQTLSGIISGGGALKADRATSGTLTLSGLNTYTGPTSFSASGNGNSAQLSVSSFDYITTGTYANHGLGSSLGAPTNALNGTINIGIGSQTTVTLKYTGAAATGETTDRVLNFTFNGNNPRVIDASGSGLLKFTSPFTGSGSALSGAGLRLDGTGLGEVAAGIANMGAGLNVTKIGTGTWTLSGTNTYSGITTISGGTLAVTYLANGAAASSIGSSSNTAANLVINGGALRFVGSANNSTDRGFTLSGAGTIEASGSGTATLTWNGSPAAITASRTLTFGGTNTGFNTFAGTLANNGANILSVTKTNSGTWVFTGGNSYTGATAIVGGVLEAVDGVSLPTSSTLQLRGGVFQSSGTFSRTIGTSSGNVGWSTSSGGFAARGGPLTIQLNGGTANVTWNAGSFVDANNALIFGSSSADSLVDFQNTLNLGSSLTGQRTIRVNDNTNSTTDIARISGVITNVVAGWGIVKTGTGVLELTGNNKYTGTTTVSNGTLLVNNTTGSGTGSGAVDIIIGSTLGGTGAISGAVTIQTGGILAPGNSIGTLTVGNLTLQSSALLAIELGAPGSSDQVVATGTLSLGGLEWSQITWTTNAGFGGGTYTLINATGLSGSLGAVTNGTIGGLSGYLWLDDSAKDLMLTVVAIPEPSALMLVGLGLFSVAFLQRFRRR